MIVLLNLYVISLMLSEGSVINSCDNAVTTVESGSFKYFRTQFQFVTANQVSVELSDVKGNVKNYLNFNGCIGRLSVSFEMKVCQNKGFNRDLYMD